jgi:hypothetical protein
MTQTPSQGQGACAAPAQAKRGRPKTRQTVTYACQTCGTSKTVYKDANRVYKYCSMACIRGKRKVDPSSKSKKLQRTNAFQKQRTKDNRVLSHTNMKLRGSCALHPIYNAGIELIVNDENLPMFCWDHIDRTQKTANVARLLKKTEELVQQEIDKCQLLCHNCHAMKGIQDGDHYSIEKQTTKQETLFDL